MSLSFRITVLNVPNYVMGQGWQHYVSTILNTDTVPSDPRSPRMLTVNATGNCHCIPTYLHPFPESVFLATDQAAYLDFMSPLASWLQMQQLPRSPDTTCCQATLLVLNKRHRDGVS